jgi:NADPH-dependent 2,4-dienoyl-CoA reductase/sulfur reductase-like enzyme/rhodanese-related sulfurtransferase
MPYYIGGEVEDARELTPRGPEFFKTKYNVDVFLYHEVLAIDPRAKKLKVKNLETGGVFEDGYDKLVVATGARADVPLIRGMDKPGVFTLRTIEDMQKIKAFVEKRKPKTAVIVGTGYIGMEMCENLHHIGVSVTMIEKRKRIMPWLDEDMSVHLENHLKEKGVRLAVGTAIDRIEEGGVCFEGGEIKGGIVIVSTGVKPNTGIAAQAGASLGETGGIRVDDRMRTSLPDVYACGDCIEVYSVADGSPMYRPLGSTANKTGRIAGDAMTGGALAFRGVLGTGIFKVFDLTVAKTGLGEDEARQKGIDVAVCHCIKPSRPEYLKGREITIKAVADRKDGRLLGAQIVGFEGVDKRIDVLVTAITFGAKAEDLFHLDLAYAPPYSTTKDPVHYTGMILENVIRRGRPVMTAGDLRSLLDAGDDVILIDTRAEAQYKKGHIKTAKSIPLAELRRKTDTLDKEAVVVTYCNKGVTGNAAQNLLKNKGFGKAFNLSGGYKNYTANYPGDVRTEE